MRMQRRTTLAAGGVALMAVLLVAAAPKPDGKVHAKVDAGLRVLEIKLGGAIAERASMAMPFGPRPKLLRDYTASIRKAAGDADIKAIVLQLSSPEVSLAQIQELGEALDEFKAAGKKVYCYTDICANRDYLVATHANHITLAPGGALVLVGLSAEVAFMKGLLDWAGIKVDVVHAGKHKAMGEPYSKEKMSDENRRVFNEFLDEMYEQFLGMIAKGRGITAAEARQLVDGGPYSAGGARVAKLIDSVGYYDQLVGRIGKDIGGEVALVKSYHRLGKKKPDLSQFNIFTLFASLRPKPPIPKTDRPKVVVIYATGPIVTGGTSSPLLGDVVTAKAIAGAFAAARKDATVKAVVLRIDSPGGAAVTSDIIWSEVVRTKKAGKPVVASMGGVAASGGYYIAMAADRIVAHPATITGSIGVIGLKPNLDGLYQKIGVNMERFTRGKNAGLLSLSSGLTEDGRQRLEALLRAVYDDFVNKAAAGRKMKRDQMIELATGRVWSGAKAKTLGLVDELGGLKKAFDLAVDLAGIKGQNVQPVILPREKEFLEMLLSGATDAEALVARRVAARIPGALRNAAPNLAVLESLSRSGALALMPYCILIQ